MDQLYGSVGMDQLYGKQKGKTVGMDQLKDSRSSHEYAGYATQAQAEPRVTYRQGRSYTIDPRPPAPVYYLPPPPPPPAPKYPHRNYHPGMPHHLRDEHYISPYLAWGSQGGPPIDHPGHPEYPLQDAWYMYPTGPWQTRWSGYIPNNQDQLLICEAKPKPDDHRMLSSTRRNNGVATNEQAFMHAEAFGREYVPHDLAIRNTRWATIGSMMPDHDEEVQEGTIEGKKRHIAMMIHEPQGMAPAVDIKGIEEKKFDYKRMYDHRKEPALFPELAARESEMEVFDDEALAEFFADPEAMLEREFKIGD